jgi:hypothetical protein
MLPTGIISKSADEKIAEMTDDEVFDLIDTLNGQGWLELATTIASRNPRANYPLEKIPGAAYAIRGRVG